LDLICFLSNRIKNLLIRSVTKKISRFVSVYMIIVWNIGAELFNNNINPLGILIDDKKYHDTRANRFLFFSSIPRLWDQMRQDEPICPDFGGTIPMLQIMFDFSGFF